MFTQLNPSIPMEIKGKGKGYAIAVLDYSQEHDLIWVVVLDDSGEIWAAPNPTVIVQKNWSLGRNPAKK